MEHICIYLGEVSQDSQKEQFSCTVLGILKVFLFALQKASDDPQIHLSDKVTLDPHLTPERELTGDILGLQASP